MARVVKVKEVDSMTVLLLRDVTGSVYVRVNKNSYSKQLSLLKQDDIVEVVGLIPNKGSYLIANQLRIVGLNLGTAISYERLATRVKAREREQLLAIIFSTLRRFMSQQGFMEMPGARGRYDALLGIADGIPRGYVLTPSFFHVFSIGFTAEAMRRYLQLTINTLQATLELSPIKESPFAVFDYAEDSSQALTKFINGMQFSLNRHPANYSSFTHDMMFERFTLIHDGQTIAIAEQNETNPKAYLSGTGSGDEIKAEYADVLRTGVPPFASYTIEVQKLLDMFEKVR